VFLSETQLRIIMSALEYWERPFMADVAGVMEHPVLHARIGQSVRRNLGTFLKILTFPNLAPTTCHSILSNAVPDGARIAFDLRQVIRHQLWQDSEGAPDSTVAASPARRTSTLVGLARIEPRESIVENLGDIDRILGEAEEKK